MAWREQLAIACVAGGGLLLLALFALTAQRTSPATQAIHPGTSFTYEFKVNDVLQEAGSEQETTSPYWWVNSGGALVIKDGLGMTLQGEAAGNDPARLAYAKNNPIDTDNGAHPQNLFRLITRSMWENPSFEASFYITRNNLSASPNRNLSNGLLIFSRYAPDGQTLYYAGIRVDGTAVIKKKYHGTYYTMAQEQIYPGTYDPAAQPNLLPHNEWIMLRSDTETKNGVVTIRLYQKRAQDADWKLLLTATDDGKTYGGTPIIDGPAYSGIRTDFMDVEFKDIHIEEQEIS